MSCKERADDSRRAAVSRRDKTTLGAVITLGGSRSPARFALGAGFASLRAATGDSRSRYASRRFRGHLSVLAGTCVAASKSQSHFMDEEFSPFRFACLNAKRDERNVLCCLGDHSLQMPWAVLCTKLFIKKAFRLHFLFP